MAFAATFVVAFVAAFVVAFVATPLIAAMARRINAVDSVTHRSLGGAVPRVGGIAVLAGVATALALDFEFLRDVSALFACAIPLMAVGFVDDFRNASPRLAAIEQHRAWAKVKLAAQIAAAVLAVTVADLLEYTTVTVPLVCAAVFFIVGYTNAFNFMDGVNGMAGLHAVVAAGTYVFLFAFPLEFPYAVLAVFVAAATAGFLPWNLFSARAYMGDIGSTTLGFLLAALAIRVAILAPNPLVAILPLIPFLADTSATLLRRAHRRERLFSAHKVHYYQRFTEQTGGRHALAAWTWTALSALYAAIGLLRVSLWWCLVPVALHVLLFVYIDRRTNHS